MHSRLTDVIEINEKVTNISNILLFHAWKFMLIEIKVTLYKMVCITSYFTKIMFQSIKINAEFVLQICKYPKGGNE